MVARRGSDEERGRASRQLVFAAAVLLECLDFLCPLASNAVKVPSEARGEPEKSRCSYRGRAQSCKCHVLYSGVKDAGGGATRE